jgi:predicted outer membrane repeat protein
LATTSSREDQPRVAATNGGDAVVVAFRKEYVGTGFDIDAYTSTNGGETWTSSYLPYTSGAEQRVDLRVSPSLGKIHAAYWREYGIQYTWAPYSDPGDWQAAELVNDTFNAADTAWPTVAVNPSRLEEKCVAWMDHRHDPTWSVYFDTADWDTATINPSGTGDFPTIQDAVDDAVGSVLILLANGTYSGPGNVDVDFLGKSIELRSVSGDPSLTIIDCQGSAQDPHRGFWFHSGEGPGAVVAGITITGGYAVAVGARNQNTGGGFLVGAGCSATLENVVFLGNKSTAGGGGLHCGTASSVTLTTCAFRENTSQSGGGGLHCGPSSAVTVTNCTFSENSGPVAGGIYLKNEASALVMNTIIANSLSGMAAYCEGTGAVELFCCDVDRNEGGDYVGCLAGQLGLNGNFSLFPRFCVPINGEYTLGEGSPCLPENNSCGVLIGAYGQGCLLTTVQGEECPSATGLFQNSPNPFNPSTMVGFDLGAPTQVKLKIYSLTGRHVATLVDQELWAGTHEYTWDGKDDTGRPVPSGTYIYRLNAGGIVKARSMVLVK